MFCNSSSSCRREKAGALPLEQIQSRMVVADVTQLSSMAMLGCAMVARIKTKAAENVASRSKGKNGSVVC